MGNTLQKVLQGRGDKKRKSFWLKKASLILPLFLTYLGLLLDFPIKIQGLWFSFSIATISFFAALHFIKKDRKYSLEFLLAVALFLSGIIQTFVFPYLRLVFFPFMILVIAFYRQKTVLSLLLLLPFLELNSILKGEHLAEETIFFLTLAGTVVLALFVKHKLRKSLQKDEPFIVREAEMESRHDKDMKSIGDEKVISHYLEETFKPDVEIKELLVVAKNTVFADSVHLFMSSAGSLKLRCTTDESGNIIPSDGGVLNRSFKEKKAFVSSDIDEKKTELGYLTKEKISSLVAVPVLDGDFPMGVMVADSARYQAFSSADTDTLQVFSQQIMRILHRERVYPKIYRNYENLKILNEESSKLLSSLKFDIIVNNFIEGAYRIVPAGICFLSPAGKDFEIFSQKGISLQEKHISQFRGGLIDIAVKNMESVYISDIRNYRTKTMPFKTHEFASIFVLPLFYERDLLGILMMLLEKTHTLSPHQIELLEVLGKQASTSIANAKFYAEIERLAVTDGLTGLFNHRHFQERLTQEFRRIERFSDPISLLLIDIDHFKKINDTYGHPIGDFVLKEIAEKIKKTIRNIDIPARYGGEEFAVVLPGTDTKGAMNMAERLRKTVKGIKFSSENENFQITISIGVATYTENILKKEELIEQADKALYHAKRSGRDQSVLWSNSVFT